MPRPCVVGIPFLQGGEDVNDLRVRLTVRATPGADVREYVKGLKCSFSSHAAGVTLRSSEIVGSKAGGVGHG